MSTNQKKMPKDKFWVRLTCIVLAAVMVIGMAMTAIFLIIDSITAANAEKEDEKGKKTAEAAIVEYVAAPAEVDDIWETNV